VLIKDTGIEIESVKVEKKVVSLLSEQEKQNTLINCLNNEVCEVIDERLMDNIKFLRIFMMMNYL
jgi:predicted house-cleaning noncanonical NTP pyrophosphatase (MazG superfamily)